MLSNIVNNSVRLSSERRELHGWDVPGCAPEDLSLALKKVRNTAPADLRKTVAALCDIGRRGDWLSEADLAELAARTGSPLSFLRRSVAAVNAWLASVDVYVARFGVPADHTVLHGPGRSYQGGIPTAMILAGDSTSLTAWALGQALLSGNPLVVKPSTVEPLSAYRFVHAVLSAGLDAPNLVLLDSSDLAERHLIERAIRACGQSVIYGEDTTVHSVYHSIDLPPQHRKIAFWTGRSGAIVYPDADITAAARDLVHGTAADRGNMCNSTKKVYVPIDLRDELERALIAEADSIRRGDPLDPATELGRLEPAGRKMAEERCAGAEVIYDRDVLLVRCRDGSPLLAEETPYPILGIRYYRADEDPIELANRTVRHTPSGMALAMSVFTRQPRLEVVRLRAHKVLRNAPTSQVDYASRHQGMYLTTALMRTTVLA
ncbi:aldehyde dehydrogenase family protein [Nocardia altamirensis]|uniref:aldehyde dehydrogenase family protein n=1 Tax=Nocardia altamirensis TaxID=472158 RepID=UPI0008402FF6|nr:aldehyde dehydrogenase family protein [Nocardia altamirensis]